MPKFDYPMPDISAPHEERAVIGAIILEPEVISDVAPILLPECFFSPTNAEIYRAIVAMDAEKKAVDLITLRNRCNTIPELKDINVAHYLVECTQVIGSGAHVVAHAHIIRDKYTARQLYAAGVEVSAKAIDPDGDITELLDKFSGMLENIRAQNIGGAARHIGDIATESLRSAEKRQILYNHNRTVGIDTGLTELNRITGGWQGSKLVILAARPAMGKTALMLHFAKTAAQAGTPVCLFSLEMSALSLSDRLLISESGVDAGLFRAGALTTDDWRKLEYAREALAKLPIYVDDKPIVSMSYIRAKCKSMKKQEHCGLIMVDYLQLADTAIDKKNRNREQEIAQASRMAKIISKELDIPFILLSQLSRKVEERGNKTPVLSDLRESGAIEQDADMVLFVHRPKYYHIDQFNDGEGRMMSTDGLGVLIVAKQRDGGIGTVLFDHNYSMTRIRDYDPSNHTSASFSPQHQPDDNPF